jgi:hypothetical protein
MGLSLRRGSRSLSGPPLVGANGSFKATSSIRGTIEHPSEILTERCRSCLPDPPFRDWISIFRAGSKGIVQTLKSKGPYHVDAALLQPISWLAPVSTIYLLSQNLPATEREVAYWH